MTPQEMQSLISDMLTQIESIRDDLGSKSPEELEAFRSALNDIIAQQDDETAQAMRQILSGVVG